MIGSKFTENNRGWCGCIGSQKKNWFAYYLLTKVMHSTFYGTVVPTLSNSIWLLCGYSFWIARMYMHPDIQFLCRLICRVLKAWVVFLVLKARAILLSATVVLEIKIVFSWCLMAVKGRLDESLSPWLQLYFSHTDRALGQVTLELWLSTDST